MNDAKFTELVNSYFDREITSSDLEWLQQELAVSPTRKREFEARLRLHQAMRMAVAAEVDEVARFSELGARKAAQASRLTAIVFGSGIAACAAVGFVLLKPVIRESEEVATIEEISAIARSDVQRFEATQSLPESRRGSLASHLRLLGLTPDMAPAERQLSGVDYEALRQREARRQYEIDRINQFKAFSAMPEPILFESLDDNPARGAQAQRWPAGFNSSLASF
ncbi:MAG: hypothetical protein ACI8Z5_002055 [Lentimonas sp.]|jgi:hypothetical protein